MFFSWPFDCVCAEGRKPGSHGQLQGRIQALVRGRAPSQTIVPTSKHWTRKYENLYLRRFGAVDILDGFSGAYSQEILTLAPGFHAGVLPWLSKIDTVLRTCVLSV